MLRAKKSMIDSHSTQRNSGAPLESALQPSSESAKVFKAEFLNNSSQQVPNYVNMDNLDNHGGYNQIYSNVSQIDSAPFCNEQSGCNCPYDQSAQASSNHKLGQNFNSTLVHDHTNYINQHGTSSIGSNYAHPTENAPTVFYTTPSYASYHANSYLDHCDRMKYEPINAGSDHPSRLSQYNGTIDPKSSQSASFVATPAASQLKSSTDTARYMEMVTLNHEKQVNSSDQLNSGSGGSNSGNNIVVHHSHSHQQHQQQENRFNPVSATTEIVSNQCNLNDQHTYRNEQMGNFITQASTIASQELRPTIRAQPISQSIDDQESIESSRHNNDNGPDYYSQSIQQQQQSQQLLMGNQVGVFNKIDSHATTRRHPNVNGKFNAPLTAPVTLENDHLSSSSHIKFPSSPLSQQHSATYSHTNSNDRRCNWPLPASMKYDCNNTGVNESSFNQVHQIHNRQCADGSDYTLPPSANLSLPTSYESQQTFSYHNQNTPAHFPVIYQ